MTKLLVLAAIAIAIAPVARAEVAAGPTGAESRDTLTPKPTLIVRTTRFGKMLFAGNGRALYAFTRDTRNGPSRCYGDCAAAWPVYFVTSTLKAGAGVQQSLLGTVKRRDGRRQVTYNGWPLYRFSSDLVPGDTNGQGVGDVWFVIDPTGAPISAT